MKKISLAFGMLFAAAVAQAQETYSNMTLTNTNDLIGTSRYVGMGGALGALGADLSTMGSNPAGTGLYRKWDVSMTAGVNFPRNKQYGMNYADNTTRGTFDQLGFVCVIKTPDSSKLRNLNIGLNYQKRANYNSAFLADNANLGGMSQMNQVADIANTGVGEQSALTGNAWDGYLMMKDAQGYYNPYGANANQYAHFTTGGLLSYDINMSFNINHRAYLGLSVGIDDVNYNRYSEYTELRDGSAAQPYQDYTIYEDQRVDGSGVNLKLGAIFRPFEESPFRFGIAFETPTWYKLQSSTFVDVYSKWSGTTDAGVETLHYLPTGYNKHEMPESYLEWNVRTPSKLRLSLGSTVDQVLAWGVEYEFANMAKMHQSYDNGYYGATSKTADKAMNQLTKDCLRGQHTLKAGFEIKPTSNWAFRMGYNFISTPYKKDAFLNQYIDSYAMDYVTGTQYMNLKPTHIGTIGLGYKHKAFYADLAYKYRYQKGDFYAFDDVNLTPTEVDLSRHAVTATLGFKF